MSLFIDTLEDSQGRFYEYGHCCQDDDAGNEYGCGMEYAWYRDLSVLEAWHDAVGQVSARMASADYIEALEAEHAEHMTWERP